MRFEQIALPAKDKYAHKHPGKKSTDEVQFAKSSIDLIAREPHTGPVFYLVTEKKTRREAGPLDEKKTNLPRVRHES